MPPQNEKHYEVPFKMMPILSVICRHEDTSEISEIPPRNAVFLQLLVCMARHPYAFTSMCGTDTAGRGALGPPPEVKAMRLGRTGQAGYSS